MFLDDFNSVLFETINRNKKKIISLFLEFNLNLQLIYEW